MNKKLLQNFNKFINAQEVEPDEVCMFIHSLLSERGYKSYRPTGLFEKEDILMDGRCDYGI